MYIKHTAVRGAGDFGGMCPCGIPAVTPVQDKLLELFDEWYGDKSYRQHEYVVQWSDVISQMIIDNMLASMSFAFEKKNEEEHEGETHRHPGDPGRAVDAGDSDRKGSDVQPA